MIQKKFSFSLLLLLTLLILWGCQSSQKRKIKIADIQTNQAIDTQTSSSILQIAPAQQHSIAILNFENQTGDQSLDWLRRGLVDMLVTELTQSPYLNVIPAKRLNEFASQHNKSEEELSDPVNAVNIATHLNAEILLFGRIYPDEDSLCIDVDLIDGKSGKFIRREMVHGRDLEQIFSMVNNLSYQVRSDLKGDLESLRTSEVSVAQMTTSLEAFRCYSKAIDNMDKFLWSEAEKCLDDAIEADSSFSAGLLRLTMLKNQLGKKEESEQLLAKTNRHKDKLSEADRFRLEMLERRMKGDFENWREMLIEAVDRFPLDIDLRIHLAQYYREVGDFDRSLIEFETVLEMDPNRKLVYNDLGYLFAHRGDFTTAIQYIDEYAELAPNEPNPYDSKGEILMMAGRLDEAIEQYKIALEKWPSFVYSAVRLSNLNAELGDYDKAIYYSDFARKSEVGGKWENDIIFSRALVHWRFGQIDQAQNYFSKILDQYPDQIGWVKFVAGMHIANGNSESAQQLYGSTFKYLEEKVKSGQADNNTINKYIGFARIIKSSPAYGAINVLEEILENEKYSEETKFKAQFTLGLLYHREGLTDKASDCFSTISLDNVDELADVFYLGWGGTWRYVFEALDIDKEMDEEDPFIQKLFSLARESERKDLEVMAHLSEARVNSNKGNLTKAAKQYQLSGTSLEKNWRVIGPFSEINKSDFSHAFPPERSIDLTATY
jgi:tetratricopeptide (TPR) repeat protein